MAFTLKFEEIQEFMEKMGVPARDSYDLPSSEKRFPDGAHFRNEISSIERPSTLKATIDEAKKHKVNIHRIMEELNQRLHPNLKTSDLGCEDMTGVPVLD